jgi:hypothetical protein
VLDGQDVCMSETVIEALHTARTAYERANEALRLAQAAAREAGVEVTPTVVEELTVKRVNVVEDDGTACGGVDLRGLPGRLRRGAPIAAAGWTRMCSVLKGFSPTPPGALLDMVS